MHRKVNTLLVGATGNLSQTLSVDLVGLGSSPVSCIPCPFPEKIELVRSVPESRYNGFLLCIVSLQCLLQGDGLSDELHLPDEGSPT